MFGLNKRATWNISKISTLKVNFLAHATKLGQDYVFLGFFYVSVVLFAGGGGGSPGPHPGGGFRGLAGGSPCTEADPSPKRRLLLRAVRILLECILVYAFVFVFEAAIIRCN